MKTKLLFLALAIIFSSKAQNHYHEFQVSNLQVRTTDGGMFLGGELDQFANKYGLGYLDSVTRNFIYAASLLFNGNDEWGILHTANPYYQYGTELFPGPFSTMGIYNNDSSIWEVSRSEIDYHLQHFSDPGYQMSTNIANWPGNGDVSIGQAQQLAPFNDLNGNGLYEPTLAEYPEIRGDKAVYVIVNDDQPHVYSNGNRIGLEVHYMLYGFDGPGVLNEQLFIRATIFNRGPVKYPQFGVSLFSDFDIGNPNDDYAGSDSLRSIAYCYNGDMIDESNGASIGFDLSPPSAGFKSLNTAASSACYYMNGGAYPHNDPNSPLQLWNEMNGLWQDGSPWVYGGAGYVGSTGATSTPANFLFNGDVDDSTTWTERSTNMAPGDRRVILNMPLVSFYPGDVLCYDFVVVSDRSTTDHFQNVTQMKMRADAIQDYYDKNYFQCGRIFAELEEETIPAFEVYPNPSKGSFSIELMRMDDAIIRIYDINGKELLSKEVDTPINTIQFDAKAGLYIVKVVQGTHQGYKRLVIE